MKIAYLILCHKNPEILEKTIAKLNSSNSNFIVHLDKKSDITPFNYLKSKYKNVFLFRNV